VTRGRLPQRAGSLGLNGAGAAAAVPHTQHSLRLMIQVDAMLTSMVADSKAIVKTGKAKYGSETVKSVNQAIPPVFILSTGRLAI